MSLTGTVANLQQRTRVYESMTRDDGLWLAKALVVGQDQCVVDMWTDDAIVHHAEVLNAQATIDDLLVVSS